MDNMLPARTTCPVRLNAIIVLMLLLLISFDSRRCLDAQAQEQVYYEDATSKVLEKGGIVQIHHNLGPLKFEISYDQKDYSRLVRLGKGHVKARVYNNFWNKDDGSPAPIISLKYSHSEELQACRSLEFSQLEIKPLVVCKPIERYIHDSELEYDAAERLSQYINDVHTPTRTVSYTKKQTFKFKSKDYNYLGITGERPERSLKLQTWELKSDVVRQYIEDILLQNDISDGWGYGTEKINKGFYFELQIMPSPDPFACHGKFILSLNSSKPYEYIFGEPLTLFEFLHYASDHVSDGVLVRFKDVRCGKLSDLTVSLNPFKVIYLVDYTYIMRSVFPYLTCKHDMTVESIPEMIQYSSSIKQMKSAATDTKYNTSIKINVTSILIPGREFKLDQTFVQDENSGEGLEEMFSVSSFLSTVVKAKWSPEQFFKQLQLFPMDASTGGFIREAHGGGNTVEYRLSPWATFSFSKLNDDEHYDINIKLKMKKDLSIISGALKRQRQNSSVSFDELMAELRRETQDKHVDDSSSNYSGFHEEL